MLKSEKDCKLDNEDCIFRVNTVLKIVYEINPDHFTAAMPLFFSFYIMHEKYRTLPSYRVPK